MKRYLLGIDYGREGAVAVMEGDSFASMRLVKVSDLYRPGADLPMLPITELRGVYVFIEDFMLRYARTVEREACIRYGILLGKILMSGGTYFRIRPAEWKRGNGLPTSSDSAERKQFSLALARTTWPGQSFPRPDWADAALIAEHGRRTMEGMG